MALIKTSRSRHAVSDAVVLDLGDLGRQAERMLEDARVEARRITEAARAEAAALVSGAESRGLEQGRQRGFTEGLEAGRIEGRAEAAADHSARLEELLERWSAALDEWEQQRSRLHADAREDVLAFAISVAGKVAHRVIEVDRAVVLDEIAGTLGMIGRRSAATVLINVEDHQLVAEALPGILERLDTTEHVSLRDDPSIPPGGCSVVTAGGRIDASVATQLRRIADSLLPASRRDLLARLDGEPPA